MGVYLDYNASAPIDNRVLDRMVDVYRNVIGNPDSRTHYYGDQAREVVEASRKKVAELLNVDPSEVYFTSGATESNNIAIQGLGDYSLSTGKNHIITSAIEHKSVLETVKHLATKGYDVDIVSPDYSGRIDPSSILGKVKDKTLLVSVMHVNNETGIIQPVDVIGKALEGTDVLFHVDATQSCGKLVDEIRSIRYDMLSFSAHKLCGPQGVGVLVLKRRNGKSLPVKAISFGGQQEKGIRPGTVPVALIAGCGEACSIAISEHSNNEQKNMLIRNMILDELRNSGLDYRLVGDQNYVISSTISVSIKGLSSEALMLCTKQFCGVSNGSACTSKSYSPSYVLTAMGYDGDFINGTIRVSWGPSTALEDVRMNIKELFKTAYGMIN